MYKQAQDLLYTELGLNPQNPLDFLTCHKKHCDNTARHCEEQSASQSLSRHCEERSDKAIQRNSDKFATSKTDAVLDCHDFATQNLAMTDKYAHLNISVRTLKQSFLTTGRLDSEYYQNKYDEIERVIKNYRGGYGKISDYFKQNKKSESFTLSEYKYIEIGDINTGTATANYNIVQTNDLPANAKILLNNGDLLISKVRPNRGAVAIINFDETDLIGSGAFCVLQEIGEIKKEVLMILLRTPLYKEWLLKFNVGTSYPVIKDEDILNLIIPKITKQTQTQIADLIKQSFALRKSASELLQTAKQKVETAIEKN